MIMMNRRSFAAGLGPIAGAILLPTGRIALGQTTSSATQDSWQDDNKEILVEWDSSLFQAPGNTGADNWEAVTLRIDGPKNQLSIWVSAYGGSMQTEAEIREYVNNDPDLMYGLSGTENERTAVGEQDGAFGVLYRPIYLGKADTWAYEEWIPATDSRRSIQVWANGIRSVFERDTIEEALSSIKINGEDAVRAIEMEELLDHIEAMNVVIP